jgi:hypothetical protein
MNKINYVDNKNFYSLMVERAKLLKDDPELKVSEAIGKIIVDISTNLQFHRQFIKYAFKEDLVGDAIENCLRYLDRFKSDEYKNPFAYFTQIAWFSFIRRIKKEYRQDDIKSSKLKSIGDIAESYILQPHDRYGYYANMAFDFEQNKISFSDDN